jgi:hypothetical protein
MTLLLHVFRMSKTCDSANVRRSWSEFYLATHIM